MSLAGRFNLLRCLRADEMTPSRLKTIDECTLHSNYHVPLFAERIEALGIEERAPDPAAYRTGKAAHTQKVIRGRYAFSGASRCALG